MQYNGSFPRDNNHVPDTTSGILSTDIQTLVGSGATVAVPIFTILGLIEVRALWGNITTTLGNHTAAYWRLNDQSAQVDISLSTGATGTGATAGGGVFRTQKATTALVFKTAASGSVLDPSTTQTLAFTPFLVTAKAGVATNIEYVYTTSDTPTTGVIQFFLRWVPLSNGAMVTSL